MKKTLISSVVALAAIVGGAANAAPNANAGTLDLNFSGTVSTTTCALDPSVGGVSGKNTVALGQTNPNTLGADVEVVFKPTTDSVASCNAGNTDFVMQWEGVGSQINANGLQASSGAASDSYVQIKATNSKTNVNKMATTERFQYEFEPSVVKGDGLKYTMNLKGGSIVGDMMATARVNYWYK